VAGVELRRDSSDQRGMVLNAILGVASESVNAMAEVMLMPSLILAFFVAELTPSYVTIGLVPAVATSLWTLARVPAMLLATLRQRQQPWAFGAALIRAAALAILAVVASRTDPASLAQSGRPLLVTFFLCLIVFTLAGGFGSVANGALLRSSISGEAWDGFVRQRSFWSIALCLVGAAVVARLLGTTALAYPGSYGRLFLAATVCLIAVAVFTAAMRESAASLLTQPDPSISPRLFRQPLFDPRFRRFIVFRILLSATAAVDPFLFLYAVTRLGAPITSIGTFAIAAVLGWAVSAPVWIWLERRSGPRAVLQSAGVLRLIAPAIALVLPQLTGITQLRERAPDSSMLVSLFSVAFFAIGAALAAQSRGNSSYLAQSAPHNQLPAYSGLTNAILVVIAFAPVLGGVLIQRSGYEAFFGAAIGIGLVAVFASGWLTDIPMSLPGRPALAPGGSDASRSWLSVRT
jgi:hypothetical protein